MATLSQTTGSRRHIFLYRIVRSPTAYRSVALHLEERNIYRDSEFVKEFPVLCDMRADYKGNKDKKGKCSLIVIMLLLLPLELQPAAGFGLSTVPLHFSLSPIFYIFSLLALEDLFLLLLSILSWVFLFVLSLPVLE
jgi:hypothetical protein